MNNKNVRSDHNSSFFHLLLLNRSEIWQFVKQNYGLLVFFASIFGGAQQLFNICSVSPVFIQYYSPKQGLIDGIAFILYLMFVVLWIIALFYVGEYFLTLKSSAVRWILFFLCFIFSVFLIFFLTFNDLFALALFYPVTIFITSFILVLDKKVANVAVAEEDCKMAPKQQQRNTAHIIILTIIIFIITWLGSLAVNYKFSTLGMYQVSNFQRIEKRVNNVTGGQYNCVYSNGDYLFLKDLSQDKYMVVHGDLVTKDLFEKLESE